MNEKTKPQANLSNDVQVIRNILFGEQLEKIQQKLDALDKELSALRKENKALWNELKTESDQRFQELAVRLEQAKNEQGESSRTLRKDFDAQLEEVSKRLLSHEEQQGGLIASLAEALLKQNNSSGG